ncbi:hypothetical protein LPTSP3_g09020 [Leptospira kobayashii]|uniref:Lipoprotein n=1 Tax=Leptospira kobayashii TaxID=1917830 RepID=A0ABM7UQU3_9LEPT|nr:hypothetical protein [Leptospira kobayashii]BDA77972.1 hypothetical protein LPTSP3_g09020 [Leptospira kobayashii]
MHRREFLEKVTLTAAVLLGLQVDAGPDVSKRSEAEEVPDWYPTLVRESGTEKKAYDLGTKIFQPGMELLEFSKLFVRELEKAYPANPIKSSAANPLSTLLEISERNQINLIIISKLIEVWRSRILFFQSETMSWQKPNADILANFRNESKELYEAILLIGLAFPLQGHFLFAERKRNELAMPLVSISFQVSEFGKTETETILFFPIGLDLKKIQEDISSQSADEVEFRFLFDDLFGRLDSLQSELQYSVTRWGQYVTRFKYLMTANVYYLKIKGSSGTIGKKKQNLLRLGIMEAAIEKIRSSAQNLQSGVYTISDRQLGQMELSSLVHVMNDISQRTVGIAKPLVDYRIQNKEGFLITISTQSSASDAIVVFDEALQKLRKERKQIMKGLSS